MFKKSELDKSLAFWTCANCYCHLELKEKFVTLLKGLALRCFFCLKCFEENVIEVQNLLTDKTLNGKYLTCFLCEGTTFELFGEYYQAQIVDGKMFHEIVFHQECFENDAKEFSFKEVKLNE